MKNVANELSLDLRSIQERIYIIRNEKVMLDKDLAILYGVPTKVLNQAVRRNIERFPADFMFELTKEELRDWKSQFVTSNPALKQSLRKAPSAFTEHGITMLSSVLNSPRAISVNIQIIRIFTKLRKMINEYQELRERVENLEKGNTKNRTEIQEVFRIINLILIQEQKPKGKIGFDTEKSSKS